jgi:hypothetical protein
MATFIHRGHTIGYQMSGSGTPILLFHGTTQAANAWNQVIEAANEPRTWVDINHSRHIASVVSSTTLVELPAGHLVISELSSEIAQLLVQHSS